MRHRAFAAFAVSVLLVPVMPVVAQPPAPKKQVKTADDLPRHTYKIAGKASEFIATDKPFMEMAAKVKSDLQADLAGYEITDRTTLQGYYLMLQSIAMLEGKYDEATGYIDRVKELEAKESKRLMIGQSLRAMVAAREAGGDGGAQRAAFAATLKKNVSALPWDKVREEVLSAKSRAEMMSASMLQGVIEAQLDPVVEQQKGEVSGEVAKQLVQMKVMKELLLPMQPVVAEVYGGIIAANVEERKDIWPARSVTLGQSGKPVVVCIWDSGLDTKALSANLYVNTKETVNGKDDDGNGFVDDVNGIAFDLENKPVPALLFPIDGLQGELSLVESHTKGMSDLQAGIDTPEAAALKKHMQSLKPEKVKAFMEDLGLYGNYSHGTHVAGIAAEGNPYAKLLACRLSFDYHEIPEQTPSEALSKSAAKMFGESVKYMKAAGVRVVNMSWGNDRASIETALEQKGVGKDSKERAEIARKLFGIERDGLEAAIRSAPEILFVAAAGNSDNDNQFAQTIPSGLAEPNLMTVGAVDQSGKPTRFTTFGKNVKVYASGYEVESYVPGGKRMRYSGTSMAAPGVTNLAGKLFALDPSLTPAKVMELIVKGSDPMDGHPELLVLNPKKSVELLGKK